MRAFFALIVCVGALQPAFGTEKPALKFIENKNQWHLSIQYRASVQGGFMSLTENGFQYDFLDYQKIKDQHLQRAHGISEGGTPLDDDAIEMRHVRVSFLGANRVIPTATGQSKEYYNYFLNDNPLHWGSKAHAYDEVLYSNFYKGIDLRVYSKGPNAKYDWIVNPGEDPSYIKWEYAGIDSLFIDNGSLHATTKLADITERKPYAFQMKGGHRYEVPVEFVLEGTTLRYVFPEGYDPCYELTIDPLLIFSTFSGATADNWGSTATPGERGTLYSAGVVRDVYGIANGQSATGKLSKTEGAFQTTHAGGFDIAIFKYDSTGAELLYATYLGGSSSDSPHSLIVNNANELLVLGSTSSFNFPTRSGAFSRTFNGGDPVQGSVIPYTNGSDIIVSRISADGTQLLSSTFLGGSKNDGINPTSGELTKNYGDEQRGDIIVDADNNVYISTVTSSEDFPVVNAFDLTYNAGDTDAVLIKMDQSLSTVEWATYLGGSKTDAAHSLKFDANGDVVTSGGTSSANFPTTSTVYQNTLAGDADGWIARIAKDGSSIKQATLTGTLGFDQVYFVDINEEGDVYVYGQTDGDFPVTANVYSNPNSGQFVQKFTTDLSTLQFSTVFGSGISIPNISPTAFLINDCGNLYMAGWGGNVNRGNGGWQSSTSNMPVTGDALQPTTRGSDFYFIVLTEDASELLYATYLGGNQSSTHVDGGTSRFDKSGVVYHAVCAGCGGGFDDFRTTSNAWSRVNNSQNCNNAAFKFDLSSLAARLQTNNLKRTMPGISTVCIPDPILFQNFSTGGERFEWDMGDNSPKRVLLDTTSFAHKYQTPGTYTVTLTAIDQGTCKVRDVATKRIRVDLALSSVQQDDALCQGDDYTLRAEGAVGYSWINENDQSSFQGATPLVEPTRTTRYFVTLTEASGCVRQDTVLLTVVPAIAPGFKLVRESNCLNRPYIAVENPQADSVDYTFTFDFGDGIQSDLAQLAHQYETDSIYTVKLIAQREFCVNETTQQVDVFSVIIPNVITPISKDGKNDVFTIQYGKVGNTPADAGLNVNLVVYNRWGKTVYENSNYQYDWSAEELASGVYFYEVTIQGYATCKDWLHIIK
jgi:hypothetical protein